MTETNSKGVMWFLVLSSAVFLAVLTSFYPGWAGNDTLDQFRQARWDQYTYNDWHPPVTTRIFQFILEVTDNFGSVFVVQTMLLAIALAGTAVVVSSNRYHMLAIALAIVLIPPLFLRYSIIGKDIFALAFFLISFALSATVSSQPRTWWRYLYLFLAIIAALLAAASRHEYALVAAPLIVLALRRDIKKIVPPHLRWLGFVAALPLAGAGLLSFVPIVERVITSGIDVEERYSAQQHRMHDLAALSLHADTILLPELFWSKPDLSLADIEANFSHYLSDFVTIEKNSALTRSRDPESLLELRKAWLNAILVYPDQYVSHRVLSYAHALGFSKQHTWPPAPRYNEEAVMRLAIQHKGDIGATPDTMFEPRPYLKGLHNAAPITRNITLWDPAIYVAILIVTFPFIALAIFSSVVRQRFGPQTRAVFALSLAALIHNLTIALFGPGYVPRYFMLSMIAAVVAAFHVTFLFSLAFGRMDRSVTPQRNAVFPLNTLWRLEAVRYTLNGFTLAVFYISAAYILEKSFNIPIWVNSTIALLFTITIQYLLHAVSTFRITLGNINQISRFVIIIVSGLMISVIITGFGPIFSDWSPLIFFILASAIIPLANYVLFKFWVFQASN